MPTSLAKIKNQIEKLQKQAANIESGIVARIKAEIAKHGLTTEQLFGASGGGADIGGRTSPKRKLTTKAAMGKTPKFADASGNTWGGMGKRPQWIHDALAAGKSLDDFLVAGRAAMPTPPGTSKKSGNEGPQALRGRKRAAPIKKTPKSTTAASPARRGRAKKEAVIATSASPRKNPAVKQPAKKAAPTRRSAKSVKPSAPAGGTADQPST